MFKNYLKIARRNLLRNKTYAVINIAGLAVGIACALVIFLVVTKERSYDRDQPYYDRIYRVVTTTVYPQGEIYNQGVPFPMRDALRISFPQLEKVAQVYSVSEGSQVDVLDPAGQETLKRFKEKESRIFLTEPELFDIFRFSWISGAPAVLREPNTVVLSESTASKYFGSVEEAQGKLIRIARTVLKVSGILEDPPENTNFPFHVLVSLENLPELKPTYINYGMDDWGGVSSSNQCFVLSATPLDVQHFNSELFPPFVKKHHKNEQASARYSLQPLSDIHFNTRFEGGFSRQVTTRETLWALTAIGLFVLVVAGINFINLATAQGIKRSREVGVRKAIGGNRSQLMGQFFMETLLITLVSVLLATALVSAGIPLINRYLDLKISFQSAGVWPVILFLLILTLLLSLLSGFYPALVVSRYEPVPALKSTFHNLKMGGVRLRSALVVIQFIIAQALIFGTLVMVKQMNLFRQTDMGFNQEAVLNIEIPGDSLHRARLETFRQQLLAVPGVTGASFSSVAPSSENNWSTNFTFEDKETDFQINLLWADPDYFEVYQLKMAAGRPVHPSDTLREFVVNETLMRKLGFQDPAEILGKRMKLGGGTGPLYPVVGVVKDFHLNPLTKEMKPFIISTYADYRYMANIRIRQAGTGRSLKRVATVWNRVFPDDLFGYTLLEEDIRDFYKQEEKLSRLFHVFCFITLLISCLGVYGLALFMVARRTKEVGVRKVLGATPGSIVLLFSREFLWMVLIAFALATPLAWWLMEQWLQGFAYRIGIGAGIVVITLLSAALVMILTVSFHSVRAALRNPVKSLRTE